MSCIWHSSAGPVDFTLQGVSASEKGHHSGWDLTWTDVDLSSTLLRPPPPESRATDCSTVSPAAIPPPLHPHYDHRIVKSLMLRLWLMADQNYLGLGRDAMEGARRTESKVNRSTTTMNGRPQRSLHPVVVTLVLAYKLFEYYYY